MDQMEKLMSKKIADMTLEDYRKISNALYYDGDMSAWMNEVIRVQSIANDIGMKQEEIFERMAWRRMVDVLTKYEHNEL